MAGFSPSSNLFYSPPSEGPGEAQEDNGIPFEEKMEGLKAQLLEQFEKVEELKEKIKLILRKYYKNTKPQGAQLPLLGRGEAKGEELKEKIKANFDKIV